ncbi:hypothetical protein FAEPRAM212_02341 [Faecalibacterium prausnitzii M21/2]|uniref:Uncharacterized protein n=1 Tax=Faecalibacterium prausnitzii M21/2 TaxID=411485 RepID=A8SDV3_9FIRM|nr:hypothetical protein FAEPRAM212_02341 [Faecalibacterium prausnitzii M21/2]
MLKAWDCRPLFCDRESLGSEILNILFYYIIPFSQKKDLEFPK